MKQLLKDIAEIAAGQGAPQGDANYCTEGTPFVKAGNLSELLDGKSIYDIQQVSEEVAKKHKLKLYRKGSVLFAKSGMSCLKGYVYVLPCDAYVVSHLACVTPHEQISEYLRFYFNWHKPNQLVKDEAYPSISLTDIGNLEIDVKDEQQRTYVVSVLSQIEQIITDRQQELQKLDELIKARFVEMFINKGYPQVEVGKLLIQNTIMEKIQDTKKEKFVTVGIRGGGARQRMIKDGKWPVPFSGYRVKAGQFIYSRIDARNGAFAILADDLDGAVVSKDFPVFTINTREILPNVFLSSVLEDGFVKQIQNSSFGATNRQRIQEEVFAKYTISLAPIVVQREYEAFVSQVCKSKVVTQKAMDEAQLLFDSLIQKYFG